MPVIGKFVIENLTIGMYDDPRSVFREYVQNSADALDKAISSSMITANQASIYIEINKDTKTIIIEDNGTGIPSNKVIPMLQNIAQSEKQIGKEKGFRGIGRLGGVGYCEKLVFETSYKGEASKSIMVWDAKRLRKIVNDRTQKEEAEKVVGSVTHFKEEIEDLNKHYFKVIMEQVTNPDLLNEKEIKDYLSMVAPVPFDSCFYYKSEIYKQLEIESIKIDEYKIFLNTEQIYKGYSTIIYKNKIGHPFKEKSGDVLNIVPFKEYSTNGELLFWGWHSISDIQNRQLDKSNRGRGLRLRKDNIQIGNEDRLEGLFGANPTDTRFNFYVFGEVYALHPELIPNGRRDDFVDSPVYSEFKEKLKPICFKIKKLAEQASKGQSAQRDIESLEEMKKQYEEKKVQGVVNKEEYQRLQLQLEVKKEKAKKGQETLKKLRDQSSKDGNQNLATILNRVFTKETILHTQEIIEEEIEAKPVYRTDKLSRLTKEQRKFLSKIFDIITKTLDSERAELVIQKIENEFM